MLTKYEIKETQYPNDHTKKTEFKIFRDTRDAMLGKQPLSYYDYGAMGGRSRGRHEWVMFGDAWNLGIGWRPVVCYTFKEADGILKNCIIEQEQERLLKETKEIIHEVKV